VVGDDDARVWELLGVVSRLRSELVNRDLFGEWMASGSPWGLRERADREPRGRPTSATTVTTSTASRSECLWSRFVGGAGIRQAAP
jgi:hypothetical protein